MSAEYISAALDLDVTGPDHTRRLALTLAQHLNAGDVLLLSGELGAGKTTFTRSLGEGLGVREGVISPTFVLSRVHPNAPEPAGRTPTRRPRPGARRRLSPLQRRRARRPGFGVLPAALCDRH